MVCDYWAAWAGQVVEGGSMRRFAVLVALVAGLVGLLAVSKRWLVLVAAARAAGLIVLRLGKEIRRCYIKEAARSSD
jgi:hypothetical protein